MQAARACERGGGGRAAGGVLSGGAAWDPSDFYHHRGVMRWADLSDKKLVPAYQLLLAEAGRARLYIWIVLLGAER